MDSAHEEPELPSAIQDLVQRLEGQGEPLTQLPDLSGPEFREFFPKRASLSTITGWRSQVRLRVLEAIGNCNTFEILDVEDIIWGDISRCWLNLASGLRGYSESKIQSLYLRYAWEDASAVKHVAEMIKSTPLLETLSLIFSEKDMEDGTVGILSQALIQSSSLKVLNLARSGKWAGPLLLKALAGDDRNRSIERLRLEVIDGLGDCLREILISNPSLKKVELARSHMSPEEWHQLGEVIRDNAIATTILARFWFEHAEWKPIEALACSASSDVNDPTLELDLFTRVEDEVMLSLHLLGSVLRGEIKSLKSLIIWKGSKKSIIFSILPMNGKTGETSVQKRLELSVRSEDLSKGVWEELLQYHVILYFKNINSKHL
ncbi:hypothetical protein AXG93_3522s1010 [Marchantia polymorpha subsp. ruderalis]|uniref:FBD domain-containing protein n=1 Tax=Marchantia polymorpha subsp. ruderalis TaxID=1480154 RepID=A0A176WDU8_MARPO|nr:hypothetical protein AXG93_3522s1010 [Marchantia polymorpha subsp. ruderalis]